MSSRIQFDHPEILQSVFVFPVNDEALLPRIE
jgi:hypothetical protein